MKKRKILIWLVILLTSLLLISSCGSKEAPEEVKVEDQVEDNQEEVKNEEPDVEISEKEDKTEDEAETVYVEEKVLLDQDDIVITVVKLAEEKFLGPYFGLLIENNSETDIMVQAVDLSVNDIMVYPIFSEAVAAGKKANAKLGFFEEDLKDADIQLITDIEFKFHIFESDSWDTIFISDAVEIQVENTGDYVQSYDFFGQVVSDTDFKITLGKLVEDAFGEPGLEIFIENNSDENIMVMAQNTSVNGFMVNPYFSASLAPGKKYKGTIIFMQEDLDSNNIEVIEEIELYFSIDESGTWDSIEDTDRVILKF